MRALVTDVDFAGNTVIDPGEEAEPEPADHPPRPADAAS